MAKKKKKTKSLKIPVAGDAQQAAARLFHDVVNPRPPASLEIQHDGDHYKNLAVQPAEYCQKNRLNCCESYAIKHITRHPFKGEGVMDLKKAIHYLQIALELEYGVSSNVVFGD